VELGPGFLVGDQDVALARPGRTPRNSPTVDDRDTEPGAARVIRTRRAHNACPDDYDLWHTLSIHDSTSAAVRGRPSDRIRYPSSVIRMSSSMRNPIPRISAGMRPSSGWK